MGKGNRHYRKIKLWLARTWRKMATEKHSAHSIALGVSFGMFCSMIPTFGGQMVVAVILALIFRASKLAAILPTWITNPFTTPFIFYFNYIIGANVLGGSAKKEVYDSFLKLASPCVADGWWACIVEKFNESLRLGVDIYLPLLVGCTIVGVLLALASYPLVKRAMLAFQERRHRKRQKWLASLMSPASKKDI